MSFFKRMMATVGIGSARVELITEGQEFRLGEEVKGKIIINHGDIDQNVQHVYLNLEMEARQGEEQIVKKVDSIKLGEGFEIQAGSAAREIPFTYRIPVNIPISANKINYTISVGLEVRNAVDPRGEKVVRIKPSLEVEAVLGALYQLGFMPKKDSGELDQGRQKFEFYPTSFMRDKLDELEIVFTDQGHELSMFMEIDRAARGLSGLIRESLDMDEHYARLTVAKDKLVTEGRPNISAANDLLTAFIEQQYNK